MGLLSKGVFKKATRSDLIAGYLGQTAIKTRDLIKECLGGVLFIDEAYALGNKDKKDTFSKECIDTLCEALSDYKDQLMVIIAGYEEELNECFFNYNPGLHSRFHWRFKIDDYTSDELRQIFLKKINDIGWTMDQDLPCSWFDNKKGVFAYYGRDMETLLTKVKIAHSRRVFCLLEESKRKILMQDIDKGYEMYLKNGDTKKRQDENHLKKQLTSMYI